MLVHFDKPSSGNEIKEALEGNDGPAKVEALQKAIMMLLNGEQLPALFITIVRYVLPSEDHTVQKLLLLYLVTYMHGPCLLLAAMSLFLDPSVTVPMQETIEKTDSNGKILPEMVSTSPISQSFCFSMLTHSKSKFRPNLSFHADFDMSKPSEQPAASK